MQVEFSVLANDFFELVNPLAGELELVVCGAVG
jgi:hypothetical protein